MELREKYKEMRMKVMALELEMNSIMAAIVEDEKTSKCCGSPFLKESMICSKCGEPSE